MKLKKTAKQLGVVAILSLASNPAMAYKYLTDTCGATKKWPTSSMTFNANPTGFTGNSAKWFNSFQVALDRVNESPVNFTAFVSLDNELDVAIGNGESEVWWINASTSATAYTITDSCGRTVETDITFDNNIPNGGYGDNMNVKTDFRGYGLEKRTFETTAIHEIGHTLGLAHENRYYNIMGNDYTFLNTTGETSLRSYLGEDATNGLIALYGSSTRQDLSTSAWRYDGTSGQYSTHRHNRLFNSSGTALSSTKVESSCTRTYCEMRHDVDLGQQIQYEMTLENNGSSSQSVQLGYYISTNATITSTDTLIGTDNVTVTRNTPDTLKRNVMIPANLQPNTDYYIGVIIDNAGSVSEWDETNNTSYIHIRTGGANNLAPLAQANGPYTGSTTNAVNFSSSGSVDTDGSISTYNWDFGDGSTSSSANPSHTYSAADTYNVSLTVTDNGGLSATDTATAVISGGGGGLTYCTATGGGNFEWIAGVAIGGVNNTSGNANYTDYTNSQTASLTTGNNAGTFTPGTTGNYNEFWSIWIDLNKDGDFTDPGEQLLNGQSSTAAINATLNVPTSAAGVSNTRMRIAMKYNSAATSSCGSIGSGEVEDYKVSIAGGGNQLPTANANGPYAGSVNANISFSSSGSVDLDGSIAAYSWSFGDGNSSTSANPVHSYSAAGAYTATLTVTDNSGGTGTATSAVTVSNGNPTTIADACATQGPTTQQALTSGNTVCVPNGANANSIQYYFILVPAGTSTMTIQSDHGTGDGDVYYRASTWATSANYDQRSFNDANTESITVNNPAQGYRFISVVGQRTGMALRVDLQ